MFALPVKPDVRGPTPKIRFVTPVYRWTQPVSTFMERRHVGCMMPAVAEHASGLPRQSLKNKDLLKNKIMKVKKFRDFNSFLIKSKESIRRLS
jgi:hypothetical protein